MNIAFHLHASQSLLRIIQEYILMSSAAYKPSECDTGRIMKITSLWLFMDSLFPVRNIIMYGFEWWAVLNRVILLFISPVAEFVCISDTVALHVWDIFIFQLNTFLSWETSNLWEIVIARVNIFSNLKSHKIRASNRVIYCILVKFRRIIMGPYWLYQCRYQIQKSTI